MSFTPKSAKNARVTFGNFVVTAKEWNVDAESDEIETTNFEGGGFYEPIGGILKATVTITLDHDTAANLYDNGITPGATYSSNGGVKLYLNATTAGTGPYWLFAKLFIKGVPMTARVHEALGNTITGTGSGTFVYPTGAA